MKLNFPKNEKLCFWNIKGIEKAKKKGILHFWLRLHIFKITILKCSTLNKIIFFSRKLLEFKVTRAVLVHNFLSFRYLQASRK